MSEQTNPEGSRRSNREVTRDLAALFMGEQEPEEVQEADGDDLDDEEIVAEGDDEGGEVEEEDGEDAEPEDESEPSDAINWTLTVNGQEHAITDAEEARSLAQRGLHYTKEMQALRDEQRQWESEKQAITAQIRQKEEQYVGALKSLEQTFAPVLGQEPDWNALYSENPEQYAHQRAQWDQLAAIRSEQQRIAAERQKEGAAQFQKRIQKEFDQLTAKVPEWTDPTKQKADIDMIREYARGVGYSDDELGQLWNHRDFLVLRDAARYRQASQTGRKEVKKAASKTVEPGQSKGTVNQKSRRQKQQRNRARQTGRVDDIAPLMRELLK
jgi:hypothetical protein